jgi:hypothetical protein
MARPRFRSVALGAIAGALMALTGGQGVAGAADGVSVVPAPASVSTTGERFALTPQSKIVVPPSSTAARPVAAQLAAILRGSTG